MSLWTEQDEEQLNKLQKKKNSSIQYSSVVQFGKSLKDMLSHTTLVGIADFKYQVGHNRYLYMETEMQLKLYDEAAEIFHQVMRSDDNTKKA